ncbi:MAG TPA: hypothetical protein VN883_13465 [Myxococcales bacterium]|jgi:hypothetical protein|nr:hypothetical protein [Myxococcales bacterium]
MNRALLIVVVPALLLGATALRAEEPAKAAEPTKVEPAKAAQPAVPAESAKAAQTAVPSEPAKAAEPAKVVGSDRPYVSAALAFLKGLTHSTRGGDAGEKGWAEAREVAADKISFKVAGRDMELDLAGKKSGARVVRFEKVSTLRDGLAVKGVSVENIEVRIGTDAYRAKGRVMLDEKDGRWTVTALEID